MSSQGFQIMAAHFVYQDCWSFDPFIKATF